MSSDATQTMTLFDALGWLETNKKRVIIGALVAVVIGGGVAIYEWQRGETEMAASDALLALKPAVSATGDETPAQASAFLKVASDYPNTAAGERALILGAGGLFAEGKFTQAQEEFARFVRERSSSPFAATAAYGVATCLEAEGKLDQALAEYQNLSVRYPNSGVLDDAKLAVGRIYEEKKQPESALRMYDELTKAASLSGSGSTAASEAMQRREDLLTRFPNLAKPEATSSSTTTVTPATTVTTPKPASVPSAPAAGKAAPAKH